VLELMGQLFEQQGIAVHRFHHITDVIPAKSGSPKVVPTDYNKRPRAWWRRVVPHQLKLLISSAQDELRYVRGVNRIIAKAAAEGRVALSDRYAYDRLIDLRLRRRPLIHRVAVRIVCSVMRRPTLTILLADDPNAVFQRKQELTIAEIAKYQDNFVSLCERLGAPLVVEPVDGRDADGVARGLAGKIIANIRENGYTVKC